MAPVIEFADVSKRFTLRHEERGSTLRDRLGGLIQSRPRGEDFWALRDVSFSVEPGESLGLVGHNGAGKSTALKLMTRILEPSSGLVAMRGRVAALLELGSGFHPDLSGRENVFLYGSLMGFGRRDMEKRLDAIIDFADIGSFFDTDVKHYSSGMYTRLAFAVATEVDPEILITDEVLAVGDESFQRRCMERIYRFRRQGKTIVFVSHALEVVRTLCDQAVWLDQGMARECGPAGQVIDAYLAEVNRRERERVENLRSERLVAQGVDLDEAEAAAQDDSRYGSGEIEITQVDFLDADGIERGIHRTRAPLTVRIYYEAHERVEWPVFGVALYHGAGLWLSGPNTSFDGVDIPAVEGVGYVDYIIAALPLLTGRYDVSVAIYDETMLNPFDYHDRRYQLTVQSRGLRERYGVLTLSGQWAWSETPTGEDTP